MDTNCAPLVEDLILFSFERNIVATCVSLCNVRLSEIDFLTPVLACKWFVLLFTHGFTAPTCSSTPVE